MERSLVAPGPPPYAGPEVMVSDLTNVTRVGEGLAMKYSFVINGACQFRVAAHPAQSAQRARGRAHAGLGDAARIRLDGLDQLLPRT
jgi:hypothetical protein